MRQRSPTRPRSRTTWSRRQAAATSRCSLGACGLTSCGMKFEIANELEERTRAPDRRRCSGGDRCHCGYLRERRRHRCRRAPVRTQLAAADQGRRRGVGRRSLARIRSPVTSVTVGRPDEYMEARADWAVRSFGEMGCSARPLRGSGSRPVRGLVRPSRCARSYTPEEATATRAPHTRARSVRRRRYRAMMSGSEASHSARSSLHHRSDRQPGPLGLARRPEVRIAIRPGCGPGSPYLGELLCARLPRCRAEQAARRSLLG